MSTDLRVFDFLGFLIEVVFGNLVVIIKRWAQPSGGKMENKWGLRNLHMRAYDGEVKVVLRCSNTHY